MSIYILNRINIINEITDDTPTCVIEEIVKCLGMDIIEDDINIDDYVITPRQRKNMMSKSRSKPDKSEKRTMSPKLRAFLDTDFD